LIDITTIIFNEITDIRFRPNFISYFILITRQNLISDRIGSAVVGIEVRGVWLIYEIYYIFIVSSELF
jgi:hypothetical protein